MVAILSHRSSVLWRMSGRIFGGWPRREVRNWRHVRSFQLRLHFQKRS